MSDDLTQQAISAAINQNWAEAVNLNQQVLKSDKDDVEALNRLGRAHLELGQPTLAKRCFHQAIKLDPYNQIAQKNLLTLSSKTFCKDNGKVPLNPNLFLEDPGKTKTTSLIEIANKNDFLFLSVGDEIKLTAKKRAIVATTQNNVYLGKLTDDLSQRLISLIKGGNQYQVNIKSVDNGEIKIFIRETLRAKKNTNIPSFPPQEIAYLAFVPPDLVHETRPEIADAEGEEKSEEGGNLEDKNEGENVTERERDFE